MKVGITCIRESFLASAEDILGGFSDSVNIGADEGGLVVLADIDSEQFSELQSKINMLNAQIDESQDAFTLTH